MEPQRNETSEQHNPTFDDLRRAVMAASSASHWLAIRYRDGRMPEVVDPTTTVWPAMGFPAGTDLLWASPPVLRDWSVAGRRRQSPLPPSIDHWKGVEAVPAQDTTETEH